MKTAILFLLVVLLPHLSQAATSDLQSGDLIFQTSQSSQSFAIMFASGSRYSHVGIVEVASNGQKYVIEAIAQVSRTPLDSWISRGRNGKYAAFRYEGISARQQQGLVNAAKNYLGRGYDIYFSSHNNEIYCSELVDLAARATGLRIGQYQKVSELNVDNEQVRSLARKRWKGHPLCGQSGSFEACWSRILNDDLITPASQAGDSHLSSVSSNY